jgi:hypothetical protein
MRSFLTLLSGVAFVAALIAALLTGPPPATRSTESRRQRPAPRGGAAIPRSSH